MDSVSGDASGTGNIFDTFANAASGLIDRVLGDYLKIFVDSGSDSTSGSIKNGVHVRGAANLSSVMTGTMTFDGAAIGANLLDLPSLSNMSIGSSGVVTVDGSVATTGRLRDCAFLSATFNINLGAGSTLIEGNTFLISTINLLTAPSYFKNGAILFSTINAGSASSRISEHFIVQSAVTGSGTLQFLNCEFIQGLTTANGVTTNVEFTNSFISSCTFSGQHNIGITAASYSITLAATYTGTVTIAANAVGTVTDNSGGGATINDLSVTGAQAAVADSAVPNVIGDTSTVNEGANINANFTEIQNQLNALIARSRTGNLIQT